MPDFEFVVLPPTEAKGWILIVDAKRLAAFLDAEYEKARARNKTKDSRKYTQDQWAADIGVTPSVLSKYLNGRMKDPRSDIIGKLSSYFAKQYGEQGRKAFLQAAGMWGDN